MAKLVVWLAIIGGAFCTDVQKPSCPESFDVVGGHCIHIYTKYFEGLAPAINWTTAAQLCSEMVTTHGWTSQLVTLDSADKLQLVSQQIMNNYTGMTLYVWWFGAHLSGSSWVWLDDTLVDPYSYIWLPDYPKNEPSVGQLVPASSSPYRIHAISTAFTALAPSFVCEAIKL